MAEQTAGRGDNAERRGAAAGANWRCDWHQQLIQPRLSGGTLKWHKTAEAAYRPSSVSSHATHSSVTKLLKVIKLSIGTHSSAGPQSIVGTHSRQSEYTVVWVVQVFALLLFVNMPQPNCKTERRKSEKAWFGYILPSCQQHLPKCNTCKTKLSTEGSTSNLKKHMVCKHLFITRSPKTLA